VALAVRGTMKRFSHDRLLDFVRERPQAGASDFGRQFLSGLILESTGGTLPPMATLRRAAVAATATPQTGRLRAYIWLGWITRMAIATLGLGVLALQWGGIYNLAATGGPLLLFLAAFVIILSAARLSTASPIYEIRFEADRLYINTIPLSAKVGPWIFLGIDWSSSPTPKLLLTPE
jgi:hypothetical protein